MSKKDDALKLALDALEYIHEGANNQGPHTGISWRCVSNKAEPAITALRDRLAQPTQEPVAEADTGGGMKIDASAPLVMTPHPAFQQQVSKPMTKQEWLSFIEKAWDTAQREAWGEPPRREWVGLTDEEMEVLEVKHAPPVHPDVKDDDWWEFARAIEAKLKEKNA